MNAPGDEKSVSADPTTPHTRRVVATSVEDIRLETVPRPEPAPGEVLVASTVIGICGTDTHAVAGAHPFIELPYRPGHEVVGAVAGLGDGVEGLEVGDRVVLEPNLVCGRCRQCRDGRYNICQDLAVFGSQAPGGMGDHFVVAADRLHRLPESMPDVTAALVEPLATPVHAVRRAAVSPGSRVAVLGAGPIGLLVLVAARAAGAAAVVVSDVLPSKRERALRLGADAALAADDPDLVTSARTALGGPADVVLDCVSSAGSVAQAVDLVDKGGTVMVVGIASGVTSVPLHLVQDREIALVGSLMYVHEDVERAVELLAGGAVDAEALVTAVFPLERAAEAFAAARDPEHLKVLVTTGAGLASPVAG